MAHQTRPGPRGFRRWRRTRPFWGGLLAVLAGAELIAIPLAPMPLVVHQGMAGVASWLIGALLAVAGVLLWTQPQQRTFYGILAVLLSLVSFLTSNFGGFLIGMLLGLVGGALGFAWTPTTPESSPSEPEEAEVVRATGGPRHGRLAAFAVPALLPLAAGLHFAAPSPSATPTPSASAEQPPPAQGGDPTSSVQRAGTPAPGQSNSVDNPATATPSATCPVKPSGTAEAETRAYLDALKKAPASCAPDAKTATAAGPSFATDVTTLKAGSLTMTGLSYDGIASLNTASGTVKALKFSMSKADLKNVDQRTAHGGTTSVLATPGLTFTGDVVMYTTKMSAKVLGIPLTFTPASPPPLVLPVMQMTDVVSEQPAVQADTTAITGLAQRV